MTDNINQLTISSELKHLTYIKKVEDCDHREHLIYRGIITIRDKPVVTIYDCKDCGTTIGLKEDQIFSLTAYQFH